MQENVSFLNSVLLTHFDFKPISETPLFDHKANYHCPYLGDSLGLSLDLTTCLF